MHTQAPILLEICVESVASAVAAQRGGASRIELCSDLLEGGVTPSAGLISSVRANISLDLHVLIRPRAGDFCYSEDELEVMRRDIQTAKDLGANGVVLGVLTPAGLIDVDRTRSLIDLARPLAVTFHRAFDMAADLFQALEDVCAAGADHILTSGGAPTCLEGADTIASLVQEARIPIIAAGGIRPNNVATILQRSGVRHIHSGLNRSVPGPMTFRNPHVCMGRTSNREYERSIVVAEDVSALLCAAVE